MYYFCGWRHSSFTRKPGAKAPHLVRLFAGLKARASTFCSTSLRLNLSLRLPALSRHDRQNDGGSFRSALQHARAADSGGEPSHSTWCVAGLTEAVVVPGARGRERRSAYAPCLVC
jgi:hypothetical protein